MAANKAYERSVARLEEELDAFASQSKNKAGLEAGFLALTGAITPGKLFDEAKAVLQEAVSNKDYPLALKLYNRKSLAGRASTFFGLKHNEYPEYILRTLRAGGDDSEALTVAFRKHLPRL